MNEGDFILPESPLGLPPSNASRWMSRHPENGPVDLTKPLPPVPRRRFGDFRPDPRPSESSRCLLSRMKRIRLDPTLSSSSAYFTSQLHQQTLQQRRQSPSAPALTLPAVNAASTPPPAASPRSRPALPMVWLAEEEMWLVADPSDPEYGYYAPGEPDEAPPAYTESPASPPSASDLSPVQTQFMSLMDSSSRPVPTYRSTTTSSAPAASTSRCGGWFGRGGEERLSPLFQEAINGVSMLEYGDSNQAPTFQQERSWRSGIGKKVNGLLGVSSALRDRDNLRRDSWHSDSGPSPVSPDEDWKRKMQRAQSAKH